MSPSKLGCWSLNLQVHRTWLFVDIGSWQMGLVKMKSLPWALIYYDWYPCKRKIWTQRHAQREDDLMRHREKTYIYKPSWQAWSRFFLYHPLKKPVLSTPWFETPSPQNCETVNSTKNSVCGGVSWRTSQTNTPLFCCYWSPNPILLVHLAS